jgi:hypothetical protein
MNRRQILAEIKRIVLANGGHAPGVQAFERTTGVKKSDWYPHIWLRWGDALVEAGYYRVNEAANFVEALHFWHASRHIPAL